MIRCHTQEMAEYLSVERGLLYGMSVVDGMWYLAETRQQLEGAGVPGKDIYIPAQKSDIPEYPEKY